MAPSLDMASLDDVLPAPAAPQTAATPPPAAAAPRTSEGTAPKQQQQKQQQTLSSAGTTPRGVLDLLPQTETPVALRRISLHSERLGEFPDMRRTSSDPTAQLRPTPANRATCKPSTDAGRRLRSPLSPSQPPPPPPAAPVLSTERRRSSGSGVPPRRTSSLSQADVTALERRRRSRESVAMSRSSSAASAASLRDPRPADDDAAADADEGWDALDILESFCSDIVGRKESLPTAVEEAPVRPKLGHFYHMLSDDSPAGSSCDLDLRPVSCPPL